MQVRDLLCSPKAFTSQQLLSAVAKTDEAHELSFFSPELSAFWCRSSSHCGWYLFSPTLRRSQSTLQWKMHAWVVHSLELTLILQQKVMRTKKVVGFLLWKKKKSANAPNPPNTAFLTLSPEFYFLYRKIEIQDFQTLTTRFGHWVFWSR